MSWRRRRRSWGPERALIAVPLTFIVLITAVDMASPPSVHLGPLLVVAPAITASFAGVWTTGLIGALAVIAQVIIGVFHGGLTTPNHEAQIAALIVVSAVIVLYRRVQDRHRSELTRVRSVFQSVQRVLMQPLPPRLGSLRMAGVYLAAEDEAHMGGDMYAATRVTGATRLLIGDVRGSGLPAIGDAALVLGAFREAAHLHQELPDVADALEASFRRNLTETSDADDETVERFVTALLLDVPDNAPVARMTLCGHPPPVILRDGRTIAVQDRRPAPPIGAGEWPEIVRHVESFPFEAGDTLLLYTDGVTEARDQTGTFYPLADRMSCWSDADPEGLLRHLCKDLVDYAGGRLGDDAAMVAIERLPLSAPGRRTGAHGGARRP